MTSSANDLTPEGQQAPPNEVDRLRRWMACCTTPWWRHISVEVTMFLYMFAFQITSVVEHDLYLQKACRVNNNLTSEICANIKKPHYKTYQLQVQNTTAVFYQWWDILGHVFPILLAPFLGAFSDKRGRKLPLLIGLAGKLYFSVMIVLNAHMTSWPVEYIIYTALIPSAMTGADVAIFASCFAYIADISTLKNRTLRVTILDICYLSAMPLGVRLGSYLFVDVFNRFYEKMFMVNAGLLLASIAYTFLFLKWQTTSKQHSLRELGCCGFWSDYFDRRHLRDSWRVLTKPRPSHRRTYLVLLLTSMAFYTFQRTEGQYLYIYTSFRFDWSISTFSNFLTFKSSAYVIAMLLAVPLMNRCFGWRDTTIIFIGAWAHSIARLFYYFAPASKFFYAGALICSLGPIVGPMLRAIASKLVPQSERGKVFALLSVCDNAVPFISGVCYSQIYRATLNESGKGGAGIFLLTITTQMAVFILMLCLHISLGQGSLDTSEEMQKESSLIENADQIQKSNSTIITTTDRG